MATERGTERSTERDIERNTNHNTERNSVRAILTAPASVRAGEVVEIRALIQHTMETGYRLGANGEELPRDLVRRVECRFDGELVFAADLHAAISANP